MTNANRKFVFKTATITAALVLTLGLCLGAYAYNVPYSYINVDINPSVELAANRFDIVIGARGLNPDGEKVLLNQDLKNKKVKESVDIVIEEAVEQGYLPKDKEGAVLLTVASKSQGKADKMKNELEEEANAEANSNGVKVEVMSQNAALERREEAIKLGISPGRLNLIQKIEAYSDDTTAFDMDKWVNSSVKEIMSEVKSLRIEEKEENKGNNGNPKNKSPKPSINPSPSASASVSPSSSASPSPTSSAAPTSTPKPEKTEKSKNPNKPN